jgi:hypothetical protein
MPSDEEVIRLIQNFSRTQIFEEKVTSAGRKYHDYRQSWKERLESEARRSLSEEQIASETLRRIQNYVRSIFTQIVVEKPITSRDIGAAFDLWNPSTQTAIEICLGAIKNEFEKDVLKAMLDHDVKKLIIMIREYKTGRSETIYGLRWFEHPYQKGVLDLVKNFKLDVDVVSLFPSTSE